MLWFSQTLDRGRLGDCGFFANFILGRAKTTAQKTATSGLPALD
jgi:hypothetical protein